jgi:hypothetical protein
MVATLSHLDFRPPSRALAPSLPTAVSGTLGFLHLPIARPVCTEYVCNQYSGVDKSSPFLQMACLGIGVSVSGVGVSAPSTYAARKHTLSL